MKLSEVQVGGRYLAKVSGRLQVFRVVRVHTRYDSFRKREKTTIECVNERTGRTIMVRSSQRLREMKIPY
jgi:hypothetical protein